MGYKSKLKENIRKPSYQLGFAVWLVVTIISGGTLALDLTPPPPREEHENLIALFQEGSPEEYQLKRLDILSRDYVFVGAHGVGNSKDGIQFVADKRSGKEIKVSVEQLATIITQQKAERGLPEEMPIYLMACNAGAGDNSYAKRLSTLLGVPVIAPDEWLVVDKLGMSRTGGSRITAFFQYGSMSLKRFSAVGDDGNG